MTSLLLHLLIALFIILYFQKVKPPIPKPKETKITLNLKNIVIPPKPPTPIVVPKALPQPIIKEIPKPIIKPIEPIIKPIPKEKIIKENKKILVQKNKEDNNITKVEPKKPKIVVSTPKVYKKRKTKNSSLANALMNSGKRLNLQESSPQPDYVSKMINRIYGKEFNSYNPEQKKFIKENLGDIHYITQKTLIRNGYPDIAIATQQQGTNIVSFYLHPNGDISDLRLKKAIGSTSLDQNTLNVIRIAYQNYPKPTKKTKIMFYVTYSLY